MADRLHLIVLKESMEILAAVIIFYDNSYLWALTHAIIQVHLLYACEIPLANLTMSMMPLNLAETMFVKMETKGHLQPLCPCHHICLSRLFQPLTRLHFPRKLVGGV